MSAPFADLQRKFAEEHARLEAERARRHEVRLMEVVYIIAFVVLAGLYLSKPNAAPAGAKGDANASASVPSTPARPADAALSMPLNWTATVEYGGKVRYYVPTQCQKYAEIIAASANGGGFTIGSETIKCKRQK